jgi:hypothetical protein
MNIVKGSAIAVAGLVAGVGLTMGSNFIVKQYTELRQDIKAASQRTVPAPTSPILISAISAPVSKNFDQLTPCEQIDSISKSGQSVSEFLVAANRVNDLAKYKVAIGSVCPWNAEQLQVADRMINPPVVVVKQRVVKQTQVVEASGSGSSSSVKSAPAPAPVWNNCNGVQEPGESYSAACHIRQLEDHIKSSQSKSDPKPQENTAPLPHDPGHSAEQ